jgi:amino acid adenylation domain-containing protein/thioester reductase-like protein
MGKVDTPFLKPGTAEGAVEYDQVINRWHATDRDFPKDKTTRDLFQEQARKTPRAVALIDGGKRISFHELDLLKNRIANYLIRNHCGPGQRITVKLENTQYLVATLLAIQGIGCVYVPVDGETPAARLRYLMKDSGSTLLFDEDRLAQDLAEILRQTDHLPYVDNVLDGGDKIECIIYTSGSTGNPKGVKINSRGIINRLHWMWNKYPFREDEVCCIKTSIGFVDHIWEIFGPLLKGIPSVLIKKKELLDLGQTIEKLAANHCTRIVLVPTLLNEILNYGPRFLSRLEKLDMWSCSGEELKYNLVNKFYETFRSGPKRLLNIYGSTEVTADATCFDTYDDYHHERDPAGLSDSPLKTTTSATTKKIPIGTPIDNTRVYILDEQLNPLPCNTIGEICISGACLSSGYVDPAASNASFPDHPIIADEKLYRTGDLGNLRADGLIEYCGRKDAQVKIRGYRIELGEIEQALLNIDGIAQACVLARDRKTASGSNKYLAAYYVPDSINAIAHSDSIWDALALVLPPYMVPDAVVQMASFPLNINGKLDKQALPEPGLEWSDGDHTPPANVTEEEMCNIWQEVLGIKNIGTTDNFFRMGGNSIMAIQVSHRMSLVLGYEIQVSDVFQHKCIAQILNHAASRTQTCIPKIHADHYPLSYAQERLWFIEQYEQGTNAYHLPHLFEVEASADLDAIKYALQQIVARHEVLRSTIRYSDDCGHAIQEVHREPLHIEEVMLAAGDDYQALVKKDIDRRFDLDVAYPIRAKFYTIQSRDSDVQGSARRTLLLINIHHIAFDGWSMDPFWRELMAYYEAYSKGAADFGLKALEIQYKHYALWQKTGLAEAIQTQLIYWKNKLSGYQPLALPTDFPRPGKRYYSGASLAFTIPWDTSRQLKALARRHGVSLHSVLLGSLNILLSKYTGQDDIVTGSVTANRHRRQTGQLIGFFSNTQVNRTILSPVQSFTDLIRQIHEEQAQAQMHQDLPFEKLVHELGIAGDDARHPLFQVLLEVQDFSSLDKNDDQQETFLRRLPTTHLYQVERFDLSIVLDGSRPELTGEVSYATTLFRQETIERIIDHYVHLLTQLSAAPEQPYHRHSLLSAKEYDEVINRWNATDRSYPKNKTIVDLFSEQAEKTPDNIALVFEKQWLTYKELDEKSNQLARQIRELYRRRTKKIMERDSLIALYLDRCLELVIAILAVMKAGGAYVPIDINHPQERVDLILEDTGAELVLSRSHLDHGSVHLPKDKVIQVDLDADFYNTNDTSHLPQYGQTSHLAYVIYTSGTTGRPRGVKVEHAALSQFVCNFRDYLRDRCDIACCSVLSLTNYVFDIFGLEYALPLITGDRVTVSSIDKATEEEISFSYIIQQTPGGLMPLAAKYGSKLSGNICLVGGEALLPSVAEKLIPSFKKVFNVYGPTETVIWSTAHEVKSMDEPYIGRPLFNEQAYVLDADRRPVPVGVKGDLYIGGAGLARGYLNLPALTADRFIPNPFATAEDGAKGYTRLYRTGDIVRWLPDGNLQFFGRHDDQVKIRGYRIELGEIEHALLRVGGIRQVSVVVRERKREDGNDKFLAAYYLPDKDSSVDQNAVRSALSRALPGYMVPSVLIQMRSWPLTANGKLDKRALPEPDFVPAPKEYIAPANDLEKSLCSIWQEVLGVEQIGTADDFFRVGGDSILSIQAANRISQRGTDCQIKDIFEYRTIARLAEYLGNANMDRDPEQDETIDWESEARLDADIRPPSSQLIPMRQPQAILLTGATGFVGAYLLSELLKQTAADIYCLVRATDTTQAMAKLRLNLDNYRLWSDEFEPRIIPVTGNLAEPRFGWTDEGFLELAEHVDAIYHNAAWVNFAFPYHLLKPTNVLGTKEILRFACSCKLKPVHHMSTYSIFSTANCSQLEKIDESTPLDSAPVSLEGYSQTKWVAERLVMEAQARGIPATIYRLGHVTGHSKTGICHTTDLLWNQVKGCIQLRVAPVLDIPVDLTPVDFLSAAIVELSQRQRHLGRVFHLMSEDRITWSELFDHARAFGYPLAPRAPEDWRRELLDRARNDPQNALYPFLSLFTNGNLWWDGVETRFSAERTCAELAGIACHPADADLLDRYFSHFVDCGFLEGLRIRRVPLSIA